MTITSDTSASSAPHRRSSRLLLLQFAFAAIVAMSIALVIYGSSFAALALSPICIGIGILVGQELDSRADAGQNTVGIWEKLKAVPVLAISAFVGVVAMFAWFLNVA